MWLLVVCLLFAGVFPAQMQNFEVLTDNFFENLKGVPVLEEGALTESSKVFIDTQIHNYLSLVTGESTPLKKKRSLLDKYTKKDKGSYILSGLTPSATLPVKFPTDAIFFEKGSKFFVATLESASPWNSADFLVIFNYHFSNKTFSEVARTPVKYATKVAVINTENVTLLTVAENTAPKSDFHDKSGVFQFDSFGLIKIQSIDMHYARDVIMWKMHNEIYMSVAQFMSNKSGKVHYEIEIPIYKWLGEHFDLVQTINGRGVRRITPYGSFLAVANFIDDLGNTKIYSEIYKFDYHGEKYELYQRILTEACTDIDIFAFGDDHNEDMFLVVANSYEIDNNNEKNYETESIIYKFVDGYFIPFQSLHMDGVEQWLPVQGPNSEFVLFASTRFDGLAAFQYDGWVFVPRKTPTILKGPGIKSLRYINIERRSTIVVSNKNNDGKSPNIFELEFTFQNSLHELYDQMSSWCDQGLEKVQNLVEGPFFEDVLGEPKRADIDEEEISSRIESLNSILDQLKIEEIYANKIIFNNVTFAHDLQATTINNFQIDNVFDNVLNIEDGFEVEAISLSSAKLEDGLTLKTINGFDSDTLVHNSDLDLETLTVLGAVTAAEGIETSHQSRLSVKNLTIGGYINDVDIPTLDKYALKKHGDQVITSNFHVDTIKGKNLEVDGKLSGKKLSDLIPVSNGNYTINQDIIFKNDIFIHDLHVSKFLNNIKVSNHRLDLLLKNVTQEQEISGTKIFNDVVIYNAIYLQGHINSKNFEKVNPVVSLSEDIFLEGDKVISGQVQIEDLLIVNDMVIPNGTYSLSKLQNEGLKLSTKNIKPHLYFTQLVNVDEIFVDTINGKNPQNFVVTGVEEPQIIDARKTFVDNLKIIGPTNAHKINGVDVEDLENKVLKVRGDQFIEGKHHIKYVIADKIETNLTEFDENLSFDIQDNLIINKNLDVDSVKVKAIIVKGLVNELQFSEIINDTVRNDRSDIIAGHKYFHNITVDILNADNVKFDEIGEFDTLELTGPLNIKNIKIENVYFDRSFNGVNSNNFGRNEDQISSVDIDHVFDNIIVYGNLYVADNKINDVDITHLANNTVKIDEPSEFDILTFEDTIVCKNLNLEGDIVNLDLDNLILSEISDTKLFNNLTINGTINILGLLNDVNLTQFCQFSQDETAINNLTIEGSAFFSKGPNIAKINNINIEYIKTRAWFSDQDTTLTGSVTLEDVTFITDIEVGGFVDNISINLLHENYFSRSKNQEIPATFYFQNDLIFGNNVTIEAITGTTNVNGVDLDQFTRTALLNDYNQVFENVAFFEKCSIQNLTGDFKVNGFDLTKDVMRYDGVNMVVGHKNFENLNVKFLKLDRIIKIQDVNILEWFKSSVLKTTSYNITGHKNFKNAYFTSNLEVGGFVNELKFDTENLLMKNLPQNITGIKTIYTSSVNPAIFKSIKLKGLLNDIDITDLIKNQAYINQDNTFKTSINLYNNISVNNLVIKKTYQSVNMSELLEQVKNLGVLNNLLDQYYKLMDMSYSLKESIERQAFFIHHYKIVQTIQFLQNSQKIICPDGVTRLGTVVTSESGVQIDLYGFHNERLKLDATIRFSEHPVYISQVLLGRYIYTETKDNIGHFTPTPLRNHTLNIRTNLTTSTTSFSLPNAQICTLFIYSNDQPNIFCEHEDTVILLQKINSPIIAQVSSTSIGGAVYLLLLTQPIEPYESRIDVWKFSNESARFEFDQSLFIAQPISVTSTSYRGKHYLAVASGHLENSMYAGRVQIYEFDEIKSKFVFLQNLEIDAPIQVEFAILPSEELILYVVSNNPIEPLLVFGYEGINGFMLKVKGSSLPQISYLNQFSGSGSHFIVAQSHEEINVIQGIFKGEIVADVI